MGPKGGEVFICHVNAILPSRAQKTRGERVGPKGGEVFICFVNAMLPSRAQKTRGERVGPKGGVFFLPLWVFFDHFGFFFYHCLPLRVFFLPLFCNSM